MMERVIDGLLAMDAWPKVVLIIVVMAILSLTIEGAVGAITNMIVLVVRGHKPQKPPEKCGDAQIIEEMSIGVAKILKSISSCPNVTQFIKDYAETMRDKLGVGVEPPPCRDALVLKQFRLGVRDVFASVEMPPSTGNATMLIDSYAKACKQQIGVQLPVSAPDVLKHPCCKPDANS